MYPSSEIFTSTGSVTLSEVISPAAVSSGTAGVQDDSNIIIHKRILNKRIFIINLRIIIILTLYFKIVK